MGYADLGLGEFTGAEEEGKMAALGGDVDGILRRECWYGCRVFFVGGGDFCLFVFDILNFYVVSDDDRLLVLLMLGLLFGILLGCPGVVALHCSKIVSLQSN